MVILVRIKDGRLKRGQKIRMMSTGAVHAVEQVGVFTPKMVPMDDLGPGEIGFITAAIKTVADCNVGDTITDDRIPAAEALPGFKPSIPVVWCGLYPIDADDFEKLRDSLGKLRLNDASFHYEPETSAALGFGFRCGFLGLLHLEIIQERLTREFDLELIATAPSVVYHIFKTNGEMMELHNPVDMPDGSVIDHIEEPWIKATIMVPDDYLGSVLQLCTERRGQQVDLTYVGNRAMAVYRIPLNEVVFDFYDRLKSVSRGYASFDYAMDGYAESDLVRISILVNGDLVDALSFIAHRARGREPRPADLRQAEGPDPQAVVQDRHPGRDRQPGGRARDDQRAVQGRDREMLRRRHQPQAQAAGEAERRQEADAPVRQGGDPAVRVPGRAEDGCVIGVCGPGVTVWYDRPLSRERWPSGLRRTLGKRVCVKAYRGFESLSLRQRNDNALIPRISTEVLGFFHSGCSTNPLHRSNGPDAETPTLHPTRWPREHLSLPRREGGEPEGLSRIWRGAGHLWSSLPQRRRR